jgi:hypothetical protein
MFYPFLSFHHRQITNYSETFFLSSEYDKLIETKLTRIIVRITFRHSLLARHTVIRKLGTTTSPAVSTSIYQIYLFILHQIEQKRYKKLKYYCNGLYNYITVASGRNKSISIKLSFNRPTTRNSRLVYIKFQRSYYV